MKIWDAIIVGAGPAGLFTAINIDSDKEVLIIEKNEQAGKKLLISGKGQCNLTHAGTVFDFFDKYNLKGRYIKRALSLFSNEDLLKYFSGRGLDCVTREDGKVFPRTFKAVDVLNVLMNHLEELNRKIYCSLKVLDIHYNEDCFEIITDNGSYYSRQVVIATGGITYPSLGTSGDGQKIAENLGHQLVPMRGGLSPIKVERLKDEDLSGIVLESVTFNLYRNDKKISSYTGDVLFTHEGLSGPGIINHSRDFRIGDEIRLDLKIDLKDLESAKSLKNSLRPFLPERLVTYLMKRTDLDFNRSSASLNLKEKKLLETNLHSVNFTIDSVGALNDSMVTCGGVGFKSVSSKTYESRLYKGLYYVGEVLDIDGETGGYNLQASFSTGYLAAQSMNKKS